MIKEYKIPKLRIITFGALMFFCVLILTGLIYISLFDDSKDVWHKIGVIIGLIFLGLIWFGISYAFLINKDKCKKCRISIKDDYYYCNKCDFEKRQSSEIQKICTVLFVT